MGFINETLRLSMSHFEPHWFYALIGIIVALVTCGFTPVVASPVMTEGEHHWVFIRRLLYFALLILAGWLAITVAAAAGTTSPTHAIAAVQRAFGRWWTALLGAFVAALMVRLIYHRYGGPFVSRIWRSLRVGQPADELSDMKSELTRDVASDYNPRTFYKPGTIFTGCDEQGAPVYLTESEWYDTHHMVVGATRFGKGKTFQIWADQAVRRGDTVFLIDPKGDKFLPGIIEESALAAGKRFISLDLANETTPGAYSPFVGGTPLDRRARFFTIMEMDERGTDADHYKALARSLSMNLFKDGETPKIRTVLQSLKAVRDQDEEAGKPLSTVIARLEEWSEYEKLNPKKAGFSVEQSLLNGAVVYVTSSIDNAVLKGATRALIVEILQESKRLERQRETKLSLFIDELRFLVSKPVMDGLATIAGAGVNMSVAFQNLGDLLTPDDTRLDGRSVQQSVTVNCQVKVVFGGTDFETAEYVAEASGTTIKTVRKFEATETNVAGGEKWAGNRTLGDQEEAVITANRVLSLAQFTGVLLRPRQLALIVGIAHITYTPKPVIAAPKAEPAAKPEQAAKPEPAAKVVAVAPAPAPAKIAPVAPAAKKAKPAAAAKPATATAPALPDPSPEPMPPVGAIDDDDDRPGWAYAADMDPADGPEVVGEPVKAPRKRKKPKAAETVENGAADAAASSEAAE